MSSECTRTSEKLYKTCTFSLLCCSMLSFVERCVYMCIHVAWRGCHLWDCGESHTPWPKGRPAEGYLPPRMQERLHWLSCRVSAKLLYPMRSCHTHHLTRLQTLLGLVSIVWNLYFRCVPVYLRMCLCMCSVWETIMQLLSDSKWIVVLNYC